jgi:hypothetical protein
MGISTKAAFSILNGWKENKSALLIIGGFEQGSGVGPKFSAVVSRIVRSSEKVFVFAGTLDGMPRELEIQLAGALFEFGINAADPTKSSASLIARLLPGGIILFVEQPSSL